jgi:predicted nuclease of restriction endonuclease-like (RecB) superfamily
VLYYIRQTVLHKWKTRELREALKNDIYKHGEHTLPNNFIETISSPRQALKTISMFKDEYLLDYINVEDIANEYDDVDERIVEKQIVRNIKKFIMTFGRDFAYVGNQYHLEAFKQELFPDLLFFNRELGCLVVVELKIGEFKNAYLGQLFGYLQILDDQIRKPHENPSIGIILCKEANKAYAEYAVRDYSKPMGIATYKTLDDMPETMRKALPDLDKMIEILDNNQDTI